MRVTKKLAEELAINLTSQLQEDVNHLKSKLCKRITEIIKADIPESVLQLSKEHKNYFNWRSSVVLHGNGFSYETWALTESLPNRGTNYCFTPSEKDSPELVKLVNKIYDKQKSIETIRINLSAAFFSLRTFENLKKQFPETEKFLPKPQTTAVAINYEQLRSLIKISA